MVRGDRRRGQCEQRRRDAGTECRERFHGLSVVDAKGGGRIAATKTGISATSASRLQVSGWRGAEPYFSSIFASRRRRYAASHRARQFLNQSLAEQIVRDTEHTK
jgi:hypothetical protein